MLPPRNRLRRSAEIGRVRQNGRRLPHPLVVLFVDKQPEDEAADSRFAFAVGRHIGKAVQRNRVKRRMRNIVRLSLDRLEGGFDCLLVARKGATIADYGSLEEAVNQLFARSKLLKREDAAFRSEGSRS